MSAEKAQEARDDFHAHLDTCRQCREHPMSLCLAGARKLETAGKLIASFGLPPIAREDKR